MDPGTCLHNILVKYVDSISYKGNNDRMNRMNRMNFYDLRHRRANQDNGGKVVPHIRNKSTSSFMDIIPMQLKFFLDKYKLHNFAKKAWSSFPTLDRHMKETLRNLSALMFPNIDTVQKQLYRSTSSGDEGLESDGGASDALGNNVCSLCGLTGETVRCNDKDVCSYCNILDRTLTEIVSGFEPVCPPEEYIPFEPSINAHNIIPVQNFIRLMYSKQSPKDNIYMSLSPSLRNIDYNILKALEIQQATIDKLTQELDDQKVAGVAAAETKLRKKDRNYQRVIIAIFIILVIAYVWLNVIYHYRVIMDQLDQYRQYKQEKKSR